ncbi:MAG: class I SAM-dependent methyltransferase [Chloroflexi bacterium HGW-Chloroflexi-10]|nr:MAG: class I SAM-dependent methyltransferase [Chloroflexi bacterium HGW-Chloroflexi-10]
MEIYMPDNKVSALIDINELKKLQEKPPLFAPGEPEFWTDPYISKQMLAYHLDQNSDAASRKGETIQRTVDWIVSFLGIKEGNSLIDLGCGPGLYTSRFAKYGLKVTGVDFSQNSINYAINSAHQQGLEITYRCQDYLQLTDEAQYDAALLIYGDFCPLSPEKRTTLLANVQRLLKPGGFFVLDVTTPFLRKYAGLKNGWYAAGSGFWKPTAHLVLEQGFDYEGDVYLDQYIVVEENAKVTVYRNWFQDYTADRIRAELQSNGFLVQSMWSDLTGTDYQQESEWIGVVARRV